MSAALKSPKFARASKGTHATGGGQQLRGGSPAGEADCRHNLCRDVPGLRGTLALDARGVRNQALQGDWLQEGIVEEAPVHGEELHGAPIAKRLDEATGRSW